MKARGRVTTYNSSMIECMLLQLWGIGFDPQNYIHPKIKSEESEASNIKC